MTDRQINIAIAEACGIISEDQWGPLYKTTSGWVRDCPDYVNDLKAMHKAEKIFNQFTTQEETYWRKLSYVKPHPVFATARQRAEAFLRTIRKCKEVRP